MVQPLELGVLASGTGTNLEAIAQAIESGRLSAVIRIVLSNVSSSGALERARRHGLKAVVVDHREFPNREAFDAQLVEILREHNVRLVVMAGFNRLLSAVMVGAFRHRILNIHPALLPAFPGINAQRQALEYGVRIAGATVHLVDEQTDHGPIVIQAAVPVHADDTEATLRDRILAQEHRIYPEAIRLFAEGRLRVAGRRVLTSVAERPPAGTLVNPPTR